MSKKIAEGIGGLVLDVKTGAGAFMKSLDDSRRLAQALVDIGNASGVRTEALITAMDAPLGRMVGNSLEVIESVETLKGNGSPDLESLSVRLAARMLIAAGLERDEPLAERRVREAIRSGAGVEKFRAIVEHQGGDPRVIDTYDRLPGTPDRHDVVAPAAGHVRALQAELVGRAAVSLGAGRATLEDVIDPGVGIEVLAPVGTRVEKGEPVLRAHHRGGRGLDDARALLEKAVGIGDQPQARRTLILERIA
jgi:pyrimidine-nucleoside phosphorylase